MTQDFMPNEDLEQMAQAITDDDTGHLFGQLQADLILARAKVAAEYRTLIWEFEELEAIAENNRDKLTQQDLLDLSDITYIVRSN